MNLATIHLWIQRILISGIGSSKNYFRIVTQVFNRGSKAIRSPPDFSS